MTSPEVLRERRTAAAYLRHLASVAPDASAAAALRVAVDGLLLGLHLDHAPVRGRALVADEDRSCGDRLPAVIVGPWTRPTSR